MMETSFASQSIFLGLIALICFGCEQLSFKEPQPKETNLLSEIPKAIRGRYFLIDKGETLKDTIIFEARGIRVGYFESDERERNADEGYFMGGIGDSLVLKEYKNYYFFNFQQKPEWILRVIKKDKNGDLQLLAPDIEGLAFKDYILKISTQVEVDSFSVNGENLYQIDPERKQLVKLIKNGYFSSQKLVKVKP